MSQTRRRFIQQSVLLVPSVGVLTSCGGGSTDQAGSLPTADSGNGSAQPSQTQPSQTQPANPQPAQGYLDLSQGLKQFGQSPVPYSKLAKPAKGQTVIDPDFGVKITRITDCVADFKNLCAAPAYPTAHAWNCDDSYFILYLPGSTAQSGGTQGWALYDGKTYAFIKMLPINPADVEQFYWDHTDPKVLRYIDNHQMGSTTLADLTAINVDTGTKTILYSFLPNNLPSGWPKSGPVRCGYPFALGYNAQGQRIWGLGAGGVSNVNGQLGLNVFGFNEATQQKTFYNTRYAPQQQARGTTPFPLLSGKGWIAPDVSSQNTSNGRVFILDTNGQYVRTVNFDAYEHCDTAMNSKGEDLLVGSQFNRATGGNGNVIVANLNTGQVFNYVGESSGWGYPATGSLSGATSWKNPAWVVTGMTGNIYGTGSNGKATPGSNGNSGPTANPCTILDQEIMITSLDSGTTWRIAHHRSTGNYSNAPQSNYWAQTNVTFSSTGTRILFQSDWGCGDPSNPVLKPNAPVDTYIIELPAYTG